MVAFLYKIGKHKHRIMHMLKYKNPILLLNVCQQSHFCRLNPKLQLHPKSSIVDQTVSVRVAGLKAHQPVTMSSKVQEGDQMFLSYAHFISDAFGKLDLTRDQAVGGTYKGVNAMGLLWSFEPVPTTRPGTVFHKKDVTTPSLIDVHLHCGHLDVDQCFGDVDVMTSSTITRWYKAVDVRRYDVREGRVRGTLFVPSGAGPFPGVVDLYGGSGGLTEHRASLLASHGFTTLALALLRYDDLPRYYTHVNVDYIEEAIDWFSGHSSVTPGGIGMLSSCKGSEFALMATAESNKVKASVNIGTYPFRTICNNYYKDVILRGVPYNMDEMKCSINGYEASTALGDITKDTLISIEKSDAKFLFIFGEEDKVVNTDLAVRKLDQIFKKTRKPNFELIRYPGAGHVIDPPNLPVCINQFLSYFGKLVNYGGEKTATAEAQKRAWPETIAFFRDNLTHSSTICNG